MSSPQAASHSPAFSPRSFIVWGICLLALHLFALSLLPVCLLPVERRISLSRRLTRRMLAFCRWLLQITQIVRISFDRELQKQLIASKPQGLLVVANHPGLFDALLLLSYMQAPCCVVKDSLRRIPALAIIFYACRWPTNADPLQLHRQLAKELQAGQQVLLFPEATRTPPNQQLGPLPASVGVALIARESQAPIIALRIELHPAWPRKGDSPVRPPSLPLAYQFTRRNGPLTLDSQLRPREFTPMLRQWLG